MARRTRFTPSAPSFPKSRAEQLGYLSHLTRGQLEERIEKINIQISRLHEGRDINWAKCALRDSEEALKIFH
jgi:hypothetical protein